MFLYNKFWISFTVINFVTQALGVNLPGQSFQLKPENLNKRLLGYKNFDRVVTGHHECASECMLLAGCESINYISGNTTCELNSEGSETVNFSDFVQSKGTIFSDISEWPKSMAMGCSSHMCGQEQRCLPLGSEDYMCMDILCREPSDTPIAAVQPGSNIAGTVRSYVFTCPEGTVVHGDTSITCLLNGEWSQLTAYCKVKTLGENCSSSDDCVETGSECILGKCFCGRLYRYDESIKDCVKVCSNMADTFTLFSETRIGGYNDIPTVVNTEQFIDECIQMSINNTDLLSFEYGLNSNDRYFCRGSFVSKEMIEDALPWVISNAHFDLYSRDCV